jgi:hypothetical protein
MRIISELKMRSREISSRLTRIAENEPLSRLSIALVVLLDLFVLFTLFTGLSEQTKQLTSPDDYIPSVCREIIIDKNWAAERRIPELSRLILQYDRSYWEIKPDKKDKHPICKGLCTTIKEMQDDKTLIAYFDERDKLIKRYDSYDNFQKLKNPEVDKILAGIKSIDEKINALVVVKGFWATIEKKGALSATLIKDLQKINFTFPMKQLLLRLLFLLPVIAVFYIWNSANIQKSRYLQTFISSHLLIVSMIPAFFEVCQAAFDIIPRHLFKKVMEFLESWNLIAIWYYILMMVAVLLSLFLIYILQKKVFTKERLIKKRLEQKKCIECGRPRVHPVQFCPFCGSSQKLTCINCQQETLQGAPFCIRCGKKT